MAWADFLETLKAKYPHMYKRYVEQGKQNELINYSKQEGKNNGKGK